MTITRTSNDTNDHTHLINKLICIDPGHASNGNDGMELAGPGSEEMRPQDRGGTVGVISGLKEHELNLIISLRLKKLFITSGAKVIMTRDDGTFYGGNKERAQIANRAHADLCLRIHGNGSQDPCKQGVMTLCPASTNGQNGYVYSESKKAATAIQTSLVKNLKATDQGIVERPDLTGFNWSDVPSILVEVGYMTNGEDDKKLSSPDYQRLISTAIFKGIEKYFSN